MIYIIRLLWILFYIPLFVIEAIIFGVLVIAYPIVGIFYFVKNGEWDFDYEVVNIVMFIDDKYKQLLEKCEDKPWEMKV